MSKSAKGILEKPGKSVNAKKGWNKAILVSCQLSNDGVYEPQQICPDVKPVETPNLGVSTIMTGFTSHNKFALECSSLKLTIFRKQYMYILVRVVFPEGMKPERIVQ